MEELLYHMHITGILDQDIPDLLIIQAERLPKPIDVQPISVKQFQERWAS